GDRADLRRTAVETGHLVLRDVPPELRGDRHVVAHRLERLAHDVFVPVRAVDFRGIEECHATINRSPEDRAALLAAARASVALADPHTAETESPNLEAGPA